LPKIIIPNIKKEHLVTMHIGGKENKEHYRICIRPKMHWNR